MKCGINGAEHDFNAIPCGINGAVRQASELWTGVNGATKKVWPTFPSVLNDNTWEQISEASSAGIAANIWEIGDCKEVTLNGTIAALNLSSYSCYVYIIGFDHNSIYEGNNRIHFLFAKTAAVSGTDIAFTDRVYNYGEGTSTAFRMNLSNIVSGGWKDSYMRNSICGTSKTNTTKTLMGAIPSELRNVLKTVTKYSNNVGDTSSASAITATTDYFFLLSVYETQGVTQWANTYEANYQRRYAYFAAVGNWIKKRHNATQYDAFWWTRTIRVSARTPSFLVNIDNKSYSSRPASDSLAFAPGFCV